MTNTNPIMNEIAEVLRCGPLNVVPRLRAMKLAPVCGRCGGSGRYSFNQQDGDRCYGCNGNGTTVPTDRQLPAMLEAAREAATNGVLDAYIVRIENIRYVKKATDKVMAAWRESRVAKAMGRIRSSHTIRDEDYPAIVPLRAANERMCDAYKTMTRGYDNLDPAEKVKVFDAALAVIADADYGVDEGVVDGANAFQDAARAERMRRVEEERAERAAQLEKDRKEMSKA